MSCISHNVPTADEAENAMKDKSSEDCTSTEHGTRTNESISLNEA